MNPSTGNSSVQGLPDDTSSSEDAVSCRPFVKWVGGKAQLLPEIVKRMPPRKGVRAYHEPFVGGGAVFFALQPGKASLSDINPELINAYQVVQRSVELLIAELKKHEHSEEYFYALRNADRSDAFQEWSPIARASRLIYLNKTCYNGLFRVNSKGLSILLLVVTRIRISLIPKIFVHALPL